MKSWALLLAVAFLFFTGTVAAVDRNAFTFTRYELDVHVQPSQQSLLVSGTVTFRNDSNDPQRRVVLQVSSSLKWTSIQLNKKAVEFISQDYTSDIDHTGSVSEAIVTLPEPIPPKHVVKLEIAYEGPITADSTRLTRIGVPKATAAHSDWDQIGSSFTAVRGVGHVVWYPVAMDAQSISDGDAMFQALGQWQERESTAEMRVNLCTDNIDMQLTMNDEPVGVHGGSMGATSGGPAFQCTKFDFLPLRSTVPLFVITSYAVLDQPSVTIHSGANHKPVAQEYASAVAKLVPVSTQWFGAPQSKIKVIELPDGDDQPYESGDLLLTPLNAGQTQAAEMAMAHQMVHTSFHSFRPWIEEGLAHFAQALERERQSDRQAALDFMNAQLPALVEDEKAEKTVDSDGGPPINQAQPLVNATEDVFFRTKAMFVWWMIRDMIGDTALQRALANYHPDQDKEASYMQRLLEAQCHRNLETFFDDWVYRDRGLPEFHVQSAFPREMLGGGYMVTVTIANRGGAGATVPVTVHAEHGELSKKLQVEAGKTAVIRIEVPAKPTEIVVNDGSVPAVATSDATFSFGQKK